MVRSEQSERSRERVVEGGTPGERYRHLPPRVPVEQLTTAVDPEPPRDTAEGLLGADDWFLRTSAG